MEFRYFDRTNSEMTISEVKRLEIWNLTMEHIFARTLERVEAGAERLLTEEAEKAE